MTWQISDQLAIGFHTYAVAGINGEGLFNLEDWGLKPLSTHTACWNGYLCRYVVRKHQLFLDQLQVSLGYYAEPDAPLVFQRKFTSQCGPDINGISPSLTEKSMDDAPKDVWSKLFKRAIIDSNYALFNNVYNHLNLKMKYSGGILVGDGYILKLHVNMGYRPAWKYETVMELRFDKGELVEQRNVSHMIKRIREKMLQRPLQPKLTAGKEELRAWIESAFDLHHDL